MCTVCLSLPFHCIPAVNMELIKRTREGCNTWFFNCTHCSNDSYAPSVTTRLAGRAMTETLERSFVFSGTNEQFGRPLSVLWVIVLSNVPRSQTFERNGIVRVESLFFLCLLLLLFSVGFVSPFEMGPLARAHRHKRRCAHHIFFHSLSEDSNESSVHLWLFCTEALR